MPLPDGTFFVGALEAVLGSWETVLLVAIPTLFVLGVLDGIFGSTNEQPEDGDVTSDGGTMFEDGEEDLEFDEGEDLFGEGEFGDDDEFDDVGGGDLADLEGRVDQLEEEISSLSSTVSTVRTENEQISETVDDIEENIRKLLDIYKMVTKGVNPFVDQEGSNISASVDDDTLGLFEEESEEDPDELDEEVMEAEAEEFFDEDFSEEETLSDDAFEEETISDDEDSFEEADFEAAEETPTEDPIDESQSFDDLKEEYEADDAGFEELDPSADTIETDDDESTLNAEAVTTSENDLETTESSRQLNTGEKPYLSTLPAGYTEDLIVLEWIEYLVEASDPQTAHQALTYYERIGWIGSDAADQLRAFLTGHPDAAEEYTTTGRPSKLTTDHHSKSLQYIARLDGRIIDGWSERRRDRWLHN